MGERERERERKRVKALERILIKERPEEKQKHCTSSLLRNGPLHLLVKLVGAWWLLCLMAPLPSGPCA